MQEKVLMKGNEALAEAAILAGCRHYFGYPITPQTEVAAYMSKKMPKIGGVFLQAESEIKELKAKLEQQNAAIAGMKTANLADNAKKVGAFEVITARLDGMTTDEMRAAGDIIKDKNDNVVALFASALDGKVLLYAFCGKEAVKNGANAGKIVKQAATITGGGGGGRPDSASAGGKDASKIDEALASVEAVLIG